MKQIKVGIHESTEYRKITKQQRLRTIKGTNKY